MIIKQEQFDCFIKYNEAFFAQRPDDTYPLNRELTEKWISQHPFEYRESARHFIDSIIHVSYDEFMSKIMSICQELQTLIQEKYSGDSQKIYIYVHENVTKSNFMVALYFYRFLSSIFTHIIVVTHSEDFKYATKNDLVIIPDDASYTGSQLLSFMGTIETSSNYFLAIPYISEESIEKLKRYTFATNDTLSLSDSTTIIKLYTSPNPLHIVFQKKYPVYFDHKLPDFLSSYSSFFSTGQSIFKNVSFKNVGPMIQNCSYGDIDCPIPFYKYFQYKYFCIEGIQTIKEVFFEYFDRSYYYYNFVSKFLNCYDRNNENDENDGKESNLCQLKYFNDITEQEETASLLGMGGSSIIYRLDDKRLSKPLVAKVINKYNPLDVNEYENYRITQDYAFKHNFHHFPIIWKYRGCEGECDFLEQFDQTFHLLNLKRGCSLLFTEYFDGDTEHIVERLHKEELISMILQIAISLYCLNKIGKYHGDLNIKNVLYTNLVNNISEVTDTNVLKYNIEDKNFFINHFGRIWVLWDFEYMQKKGEPIHNNILEIVKDLFSEKEYTELIGEEGKIKGTWIFDLLFFIKDLSTKYSTLDVPFQEWISRLIIVYNRGEEGVMPENFPAFLDLLKSLGISQNINGMYTQAFNDMIRFFEPIQPDYPRPPPLSAPEENEDEEKQDTGDYAPLKHM